MHENCETFICGIQYTKGAAHRAQSSFRVYGVAARLCFATPVAEQAQLSCSCAHWSDSHRDRDSLHGTWTENL